MSAQNPCRVCSKVTPEEWAYVTNRVRQMRQRCQNPDHPKFRHYGGRGIRFRFHSIRTAALYILSQFSIEEIKKFQIDRIDNDAHYEKGNLRLADREEQRGNRRLPLKDRPMYELRDEIKFLRAEVRRLRKENAELRELPF